MVVKCRVPSRGSASATSYSTLAILLWKLKDGMVGGKPIADYVCLYLHCEKLEP